MQGNQVIRKVSGGESKQSEKLQMSLVDYWKSKQSNKRRHVSLGSTPIKNTEELLVRNIPNLVIKPKVSKKSIQFSSQESVEELFVNDYPVLTDYQTSTRPSNS